MNVIHQDRDGVMWLGTDRGLVRYANGRATLFTSRDGLPGDTVRVLIDTRDGLSIGVYGGLARWKDGKFTSWTDRDGMPGSTVRALYEDARGVLWIGTYDSGLGRFQDGRFTRYTTRDGLFNDGVFQILEDSRGNLWMSSNRGISLVRKQELDDVAAGQRRSISSVAYGKADGMANVARATAVCGPRAIARTTAACRTQQKRRSHNQSRLHHGPAQFATRGDRVAAYRSRARHRLPNERSGSNRPGVAEPRDPVPPASASAIQGASDSDTSSQVSITTGSRPVTRRTAYYSHTPPGRYMFTVAAAHRDGEWSTETAMVVLDVLPPFYRTWWFLTAVSLSVMSLLIAAYRYRVAQLTRVQAAQQAFSRELIASQERERQRIAGELHDSLGRAWRSSRTGRS